MQPIPKLLQHHIVQRAIVGSEVVEGERPAASDATVAASGAACGAGGAGGRAAADGAPERGGAVVAPAENILKYAQNMAKFP